MDLSKGFQIEQPKVFVPWNIAEEELQRLDGLCLRRVTEGYFTAHCTSLAGLSHELGFHFDQAGDGSLVELEFFRSSCTDLVASYQQFQRHLESTFGRPTSTASGSAGFPSHNWRLPGADVVHYVLERFGAEEHVKITRIR